MLVGAHALLANGGVMAAVGARLVALSAQRHAVPFVVLAGLHKLSPLFPHDPAITFNEFKVARTVCDEKLLCPLICLSTDACLHADLPCTSCRQYFRTTRPLPPMSGGAHKLCCSAGLDTLKQTEKQCSPHSLLLKGF